ncbi:PREDICTED: uncharacterized protein LOC104728787 [Camelina sativa]|uniref:Uncharacterized protein LOC104728787 n=1 Tax=Camelina sativa TaxID=90675 RepID=A0ABM0UTC8_CAMSA|nr:PREDICTED: uncharacterized protein LOC104728787 [Camelina sativa]
MARLGVPNTFQAHGCGPEITPLLAKVWRVTCPPKVKHFMWQVLTGSISVSANLRRRGIDCDVGCMRCGADVETINHVIFVCPPARQVWALSHVPVGPQHFPTDSIYVNVDHFLGSTNPGSQIEIFPWLMWYIWKVRNACVFENQTERPDDIVRVAQGEASSWLKAQVEDEGEEVISSPVVPTSRLQGRLSPLPLVYCGYRCFVDGSWKETDVFAGARWFCTSSQGSSPFLGATNYRRSLSPLHAEVEAFSWAMRCMIGHNFRDVAFFTDSLDLVKMVSSPRDWPAFATYLDGIKTDREEFSSFSLFHIFRNANTKTDSLARQARLSPHLVLFVNNFPSNWLI